MMYDTNVLDCKLRELDSMSEQARSFIKSGIKVCEEDLERKYHETLDDFAKRSELLEESMRTGRPITQILKPTFQNALRELKSSKFKKSAYFDSEEFQKVAKDIKDNLVYTDWFISGRGGYVRGPGTDLRIRTYPFSSFMLIPALFTLEARFNSARLFKLNGSNCTMWGLNYIDRKVKEIMREKRE